MNSIARKENVVTSQPLARLIHPRSIAIIGASPDARKLSGRPLSYLRKYGFGGQVFPVNPKYDAIDGTRCYPSVEALPPDVDLALILLPSQGVAEALEACGRRGISFAISIASGFAEAGAHAEQAQLTEICKRHGIRLVGPNCVGLLNPRHGVTATFSSELQNAMPRLGSTALLTQSGALGNSLLQSFNDLDIGLSAWVSTGNEADLGLLELVEHFVEDPATRLIALYVEGLNDGHRLRALARRAKAAGKAIAVLRSGRSQLGRAAAISHTGKLAGAWRVWQDVARQSGLIEVESLDALVDLALVVDRIGFPKAGAPNGLGVLTVSGGLGVLISDAAAGSTLPLAHFSEATRTALRALLPPQMSVANPVDAALFTDERGYTGCATSVLADPGVGTLLLILTSLAHDYAALLPWLEQLGAQAREAGKCVALSFLSSSDPMSREQRQRLLGAGVIVLPTAERVVAAVGRREATRSEGVDLAAPVTPRPALASAGDRTPAGFLERARIPLVPEQVCTTAPAAVAFAEQFGYPVVLKVVSADIAHKSEVGGVALNLGDATALRAAWDRMDSTVRARAPQAVISGYSVQPQVSEGVELIVGCSVDAELGRVVMVGAGGIWAEVLDDVRFLALPTTETEIRGALQSLRVAPLFVGARGKPPVDLDAAIDVIGRIAQAFADETWVGEVDLNPLLMRPNRGGALALDVLVVPATAPSTSH